MADKSKFSFQRLFNNNRFVLVISVVAAFAIWLSSTISSSEERTRVISNVPVEVVLSDTAQDQNMRVFEQSQTVGSVSIKGSSLIINKISSSDLKITAVLNPTSLKTSTSGMETYTLTLTAAKNGNELADFEVSKVEPAAIDVRADVYKEYSFPIENGIEYSVNDAYFAGSPGISEESVVISGPQSSVNRVSRVTAEYKISDPLTESKSFSCGLVMYDADGNVIQDNFLNMSVDIVDVNITVLSRKTLSIEPNIINKPAGISNSRISITPASIEVAGAADALASLNKLTLDNTIDFTKFNIASSSVDVDVSLPAGFKNISNTYKASVSVDLSGFTQGTFTTSNISVKNASDQQKVDLLTKELEVTVIGSQAQISRLTGASIYCTVDMTNVRDVYGSMELTATVSVVNANTCWVYGTYTVNINVSQPAASSASSG